MNFEKIKDIILEQLGVDDTEDINRDTLLIGDLDADSLDAVEIVMSLEDEFDIEIEDEVAEKFKTIGDIVDYIEKELE
ncbi:MAG: acyl carrier protein [Clostridiales bacterium]|nr:acyl carrier protein [Clostridiales bacterium]